MVTLSFIETQRALMNRTMALSLPCSAMHPLQHTEKIAIGRAEIQEGLCHHALLA